MEKKIRKTIIDNLNKNRPKNSYSSISNNIVIILIVLQ